MEFAYLATISPRITSMGNLSRSVMVIRYIVFHALNVINCATSGRHLTLSPPNLVDVPRIAQPSSFCSYIVLYIDQKVTQFE